MGTDSEGKYVDKDVSLLQTLIQRIKENDLAAFKEFFLIHQPGIFRFLFRYLADRELAEDLTQDTFIKFWLIRDKLDTSSSPKAYLYKIARNLALNSINRKPPVTSITSNGSFFQSIISNTENDYDRIFLLDEFQKAVNTLPERCRATFILSRYDGFEYSEIAEILHVSLQTVKNQMNKAIAVLRKRLASHLS